jgi:hypothetical protein
MQKNVLGSWLLRLFSLGGLKSVCQDRLKCQSAADVVIVVVSEIVVSGLWYLEDRLVGTSWEVQVKWGGIADGHRGDGGKECSMITIWLDEERYLE